jgi:hypothetical protein
MRFGDGSDDKRTTDFVQMSEEVLLSSWKWLDKFAGKKSWVVHGKSILTETEKAREMKIKVNSMLVIFFDMKGIVREEFVLPRQTVNSAYYSDILRRLHENMQTSH